MNIAVANSAERRVARGETTIRMPIHASRITHHAPRSTEQGIALVIVMISIFVLAMLAGGFAYSMKVETKLASNGNSEEELQWLGRSGVEYARWVLANSMADPTKPYESLDQPWATGSGFLGPTNAPIGEVQNPFTLGSGNVKWKISDLERKWNINTMLQPGGQDLLQNAFMNMGLDAGDMTPLVNSILNWMDKGNRIQGARSEDYERMNPPYSAKNGPIDDISELLMIRGITPEMYWGTSAGDHPPGVFTPREKRSHMPTDMPSFPVGLVDIYTPISSGKININTASAAVLQLIPGMTPMAAEGIASTRSGEDDGSGLTGPYRNVGDVRRVPEVTMEMARAIQQFGDVRSRTFKVDVEATVGGYTRYFTAILGRNNPRDVQILSFYWSDPEQQKH